MTTRIQLTLSFAAALTACGPQLQASREPVQIGLAQQTSSDAGQDPDAGRGEPDSGGGSPDAGSPQAPLATLRLSGTAAATLGDALVAGPGAQPVLQAFVAGAVPPLVHFQLYVPDGGPFVGTDVLTPTHDAVGNHFDLPIDTRSWGEGTYRTIASIAVGDASVDSNPIEVLVDRTPPSITLLLSTDGGTVPRDAKVPVALSAVDGDGSGVINLTLAVTGREVDTATAPRGVVLPPFLFPQIDFPLTLSLDQGAANADATLDLTQVPYDAWSTAQDGVPFSVIVTATDLAGNLATAAVDLPATRALWTASTAGGPLSLGARGQVLINGGDTLITLSPDGATATYLSLGIIDATVPSGPPATSIAALPAGEIYLVANEVGLGGETHTQFISVTPGNQIALASIWGPEFSLPALRADGSGFYAVNDACQPVNFDASLNRLDTDDRFTVTECIRSELAFDGVTLTAAGASGLAQFTAGTNLSETFLDYDGQPPVVVGFGSCFSGITGGLLAQLFPAVAGAPTTLALANPGAAARAIAIDSHTHIYVLDENALLSDVTAPGWSTQLAGGPNAWVESLTVGADGLVYATDGTGTLTVLDSTGHVHWRSPAGSVEGPVMIDRCTAHAFSNTASGTATALVVDSRGVDASPNSWPMPGHDVFQSNNTQSTDDVDCANHL